MAIKIRREKCVEGVYVGIVCKWMASNTRDGAAIVPEECIVRNQH